MAKRPVSRSTKPKRQLDRIDPKRSLDLDEFAKLKSWALAILAEKTKADFHTIRNAAIVLTLLGTGARRFELCAFRCGDFYQIDGEPRARFDQAKGNVEAEVAISDEAWKAVQDWIALKAAFGEPEARHVAPLLRPQQRAPLPRAAQQHLERDHPNRRPHQARWSELSRQQARRGATAPARHEQPLADVAVPAPRVRADH